MNRDSIDKITHAEILGILSSWFIMIGAFLPWAYVNSGNEWGYEVMGFETCTGFTLFFGTICFLLFYFGNKFIGKYKTFLGVLLLGILILFLVLSQTPNISNYHDSSYLYYSFSESDYNIEYSYGYYLTLFGSIGLLISAAWLFIDTFKMGTK